MVKLPKKKKEIITGPIMTAENMPKLDSNFNYNPLQNVGEGLDLPIKTTLYEASYEAS